MTIAIVGTGPTALYTLKALIELHRPCDIVLFEAGEVAGPGFPFCTARNSPAALANIAGVELPPLTETLNQWALRQSAEKLEAWGIAGHAGDERAFFPRVVLGAYFVDQLQRMVDNSHGHRVTLRQRTQVTDVIARTDGAVLRWRKGRSDGEDRFDRLVIATGYRAPHSKTAGDILKGQAVGVLGTSLSAIDVAVEQALHHGRFVRAGGGLRFEGRIDWHVTLLSRSGLLPEADFWFPYPPEPLDIFTDVALAPLVSGQNGDLDKVFALFARQLRVLDPVYAEAIGLDRADADNFANLHFARRLASDPFAWAVRDLAHARKSHRTQRTDPWRYAMLRMHEPFGRIIARLSQRDMKRFERGLKRCFTDNYAAVPHLSILRLLAMHEAGVLSVKALGEHYSLSHVGEGWHIRAAGFDQVFDAMVDARGQQALGLTQFPFPTLRLQLCAHALAHNHDSSEGLPADAAANGYRLDAGDPALSRIHCVALPFLLKRHPFIQGLVESAAMARSAVSTMMETGAGTLQPVDVKLMIARIADDVPVYCGSSGVITVPRPPFAGVEGEECL